MCRKRTCNPAGVYQVLSAGFEPKLALVSFAELVLFFDF
jgi:hypothetical protein